MKNFKLKLEEFKQLISPMGSCVATDKITVDGLPVGYMYREDPDDETDSGWRFFSGTETQEYADDAENMMLYDVNTIANYDPIIIPYLNSTFGAELERSDNGFQIITED